MDAPQAVVAMHPEYWLGGVPAEGGAGARKPFSIALGVSAASGFLAP